jgi:CubicO group peptidase (beta-lactamase class C family)
MKSFIALVVLVLFSGSTGQLFGQELEMVVPSDVGMSADKLAAVDAAMEDFIEAGTIPGGVVMIARHGKVVHFKAYGKMDLENDQRMTTDTIMRFYSMTKAITTTAAMMLVEEKRLAIDDPVSKYLPELNTVTVVDGDEIRPATHVMTIADLMRHTAGYSYGDSGVGPHDSVYRDLDLLNTTETLEAMQAKLARLPLAFEPGTDWQYGISIDVLGRVVEVASGQTLEEFFTQRIFEPLDMLDTAFYVPAEKVDRFAANYRPDGEGKLSVIDAPSTSRYRIRPAFFGGGGGLVSTARDYMRFLLMIAGDGELNGVRLLKPETVQRMISDQLPEDIGWIKFGKDVREGVGFGFGFNVRVADSEWDPQGRVGEYGWGGAASTHYWVSPTDDLAVITLEQIMPYSAMTELKLKGLIYDAILDE